MFKNKKIPDSDLIDGIIALNKKSENNLYLQHKQYCMAFMNRMHTDVEKNEELYTDAIIVFIEKIRYKDLQLNQTSIQTYLNSICRYQILDRYKKTNKVILVDNTEQDFAEKYNDWYEVEESINDNRMDLMLTTLNEMKVNKEKCYELLYLFFYEKLNQSQIATKLNYASADVVKSESSRCKKKLRTHLQNQTNYE